MLNDLVIGNKYSNEIYLCKPYSSISGSTPNHEIIGCLTGCSIINNINYQIQSVNEITLEIYKYWNEIQSLWNGYDLRTNENFDLINDGMYILLETYIDDTLQKQEYYYIYNINLSGSEKTTKTVNAYSKEYLWNRIKIRDFIDSDDFSTTRKIYTGNTFEPATPELGGIMDYVIQEKLNDTWTVSYVSPAISDIYRTFDFSESTITEVIRQIESLYNCVCFVDNYYHQIRFVHYDELPSESNLIIADSNFLKTIKKDIKSDEIVTRLYVNGTGDIIINGVNPTGKPYLDDFTYFRTTDYMSQELLDALTAYDLRKASATPTYSSLLDQLETEQTELSVLDLALYSLNTDLLQYQDNEDLALKFAQSTYNACHTIVLAQEALVTAKESEITAKELEIANTQNQLSAIVEQLEYVTSDATPNLTLEQLKELTQFINEDTISCDATTEEELLSYGQEILTIRATPPIEFTIDVADLFSTVDGNYEWDKIALGEIVNLEFDELSIQTQPRIIGYNYSPNGNTLSLTISNKYYLNSDIDYIGALIASTKKNSTIIDNERDTYLEYSEDKESILTTDSTISTEDNEVVMNDGSILTRRGYYLRDILDASGQMRILGDRILFTNNNWADIDGISTAITSEGIFCEDFLTFRLRLISESTDNIIYLNPDVGIQILQGSTPTFWAEADGSLHLKNIYITNEDESISISPDLIDITNGRIRIRNIEGQTIMIDEHGIDPDFLDYNKNYVYNSSFENYDITTNLPNYWDGGVSTSAASFHGSRSLKLEVDESSMQTDSAAINPLFIDYHTVRVAFHAKVTLTGTAYISVRVYDKTNDSYFTLIDINEIGTLSDTDTRITFETPDTWIDSRFSFSFDPAEAGHPDCVDYQIKFENLASKGSLNYLYVDSVQACYDFTGKWPQIYKDGPKSMTATEVGDFEYWTNYYTQSIYVQPDEPASPEEDDCWIDTDNYTRYDVLEITEDTTVLMADEETIMVSVSGVTVTLQTPTQSGCLKVIKNISSGKITISGSIDGDSTKYLYTKECIHLISFNNIWYIC